MAKFNVRTSRTPIEKLINIARICQLVSRWLKKHPGINKLDPDASQLELVYEHISEWMDYADNIDKLTANKTKRFREAHSNCVEKIRQANFHLTELFSMDSYENTPL
jgi:hypothetical protein